MNLSKTKKRQLWVALATLSAIPAAQAGKGQEFDVIIDSGLSVNAGIGSAALSTARATTRDVGDRLFRMRAGLRPMTTTEETVVDGATDSKGGMSKTPITRTVTSMRCWEIYGSLFYYTENQDRQVLVVNQNVPGALRGTRVLGNPGTDVDIFGGNVGIERHFNENWSAGFAVGGASTDVDMSFFGSSDIDSLTLTPYISFYEADMLGSADFWADLMYSHGFHDFDLRRASFGGFASASPEADTDQVEFTTGLNFQSGSVTHGPFAGLRWIDGSIDAYTEVGPGAGFFPEQDIESLASILGYQLSFPIQLTGGTLVPQVRAAWEHEFEDDGNVLFGFPLGEPDEDVAVLGTGIGFYCNSGWNAVLDYEARLSSHVEGHYVGLKVGKEF
ncbi:autotransporter outer membrane beta-barrel domain-containing protein [Luteolibacter marinus]|uniref:autotransporter outer membrane beta-barrel domain-containing protein n=1 Tax=Luteolibacter marinus TaxID=2776705 RepID=UPI001868074A|nr:autotransporter outer membrane beta-barrel domain-containing protein [Luteolibacter marinus]